MSQPSFLCKGGFEGDEMDEDGCTLYDLEQDVLSGTIVERNKSA